MLICFDGDRGHVTGNDLELIRFGDLTSRQSRMPDVKSLLKSGLGQTAIREIINCLRAHVTRHHWIEMYRRDVFVHSCQYTHNPTYAMQVLYDSLENLSAQIDVNLAALRRPLTFRQTKFS